MIRLILILISIVIATAGGVIAYRALFLEPSAAVVITSTETREIPNYARVIGGMALLLAGSAAAVFAAMKGARR